MAPAQLKDHSACLPFDILEQILRCHVEPEDAGEARDFDDDFDPVADGDPEEADAQAYEIDTVLVWSHVCRRWRELALQHRAYAQRITWDNNDDGHWSHRLPDATFLRDRLQVSAKPLDFELVLGTDDPSFVYDTLLPALSRELHRVRTLYVEADRQTFPKLMRALARPAPVLRDLVLKYTSSDGRPLKFSSLFRQRKLFAGKAPLLQQLGMEDIELPSALPPAFAAVTHIGLKFGCGVRYKAMQYLCLFPRLKHLTLSFDDVVEFDSSLRASRAFPLLLDSVSLVHDSSWVTLLPHLVSTDTTSIHSYYPNDPDLASYLFGAEQLPPGALHAFLLPDKLVGLWATFHLHHPESGRHRSVSDEWISRVLDAVPHIRIVELTVDIGLYPVLAVAFDSMPALHTLVLVSSLSSSHFYPQDQGEDNSDASQTDDLQVGWFGQISGMMHYTIDVFRAILFRTAGWSTITTTTTTPSSETARPQRFFPLRGLQGLNSPSVLRCSSLSKLVLATSKPLPDVTAVDSIIAFMESELCHHAHGTVDLELRNTALAGDTLRLSGFFRRVVTVPGLFEEPNLQGDRPEVY
ncbi:hypothetical protein EXIGLDRAFT_726262 [Exidia glandulosa HHB12029]|uniref:F-box domain-containing protein n=1 Tax=Exidia glandulosa HHB12029 TaxID=1314781 RepID=A0A165DU29_EXIGL|nr:hypothetical protein EXIGLDRAFT_726262 [Exidia glandulosa HHB12029]